MMRKYEICVSETKDLPYFGPSEVFRGPKVDIHVSDIGVGITPNFFNVSCVDHFSTLLSKNIDAKNSISDNLRLALRGESYSRNEIENDLDLPQNSDYPIELTLFHMGFFAKYDTLVVQEGIVNPCMYWDHAASGKFGTKVANLEGLVQLIDIFKKNKEIFSYPARLGEDMNSKPMLLFSPIKSELVGQQYFGLHRVLIHDRYHVA